MTAHNVLISSSVLGSRRELLIGAGCMFAAGTAFAMTPRHHVDFLGGGSIERLVPKQIGDWSFVDSSGLILPPQDQLRDQLYSQLLTRTYANGAGDQIMLLIAYNGSQDGVVQLHRPEICYPASGFRLTEIAEHDLRLAADLALPARYIVAETSTRREALIYWTRLGNYFPRRWSDQRWAVFAQNLHGDIPDGLLVRISSVAPGVGAPALDAFARALYDGVSPQMRKVLVGDHR